VSGLGAVVIGRNEGRHLERCLASFPQRVARLVYVDSGSTDDSVRLARSLGVETVVLDTGAPFTAARARNAGADQLLAIDPGIEFIQFVDGDCELIPGWLERGLAELRANPGVGAVCGRRRERFPLASPYNTLCEIEWDTPIGEAKFCGGDVMIRVRAFREVGGYNPFMIGGEEPELCVRLRARGWKIHRIAADMTIHDAALASFRQWWRRAERAGYAYAHGATLQGWRPERHWVRESRSNWFWGLLLPLTAAGGAVFGMRGSWLLLLAYPALFVHICARTRRGGRRAREAALYAAFCTLGKFPGLAGQIRFQVDSWRSPEIAQPRASG
jgi:GT2 family glycosyltransferase